LAALEELVDHRVDVLKLLIAIRVGRSFPRLGIGLEAKGGRKPISPNDPRVQTAKTMHGDKDMAIGSICKTLGILRSTFYRYLAISD
jgi:hypothetical protein